MIPPSITREHIIKAIQEIESSKGDIPPNRESVNYDVIYEGKPYPPKYVISLANKYANGSELSSNEFDAIEAKTFLPKLKFDVKLKIDIKPGIVLGNQQISTLFGCGTQGGMRKSNKTNTLVIISDQTKPFYKDEWVGDILNYTGMGISGDQKIDYMQNKTLAESKTNGFEVHLFEVFSPGKYTYQGIVELARNPEEKNQKDKDGINRKVVIFPLKLVNGKKTSPDSIIIAGIGNSNKSWKGYEEKDISLNYIPREAWNFYDFNDQEYFGFISDTTPTKFNEGGLVLLTTTDQLTKKRLFIGFYGNTQFGTFTLPVDISDTIANKEIQQQFKQKFTDPVPLNTRHLLAEKSQSTYFLKPIEFDLDEIGVKTWNQAPFMYVGEGKTISKKNMRNLILKSLKSQQDLLTKSTEADKEKIRSDIIKTQKILEKYFADFEDARSYWAILPSSSKPTGNQREMWPIWESQKIVSIQWKDLAEKLGNKLFNFSSREEYEAEYRKIYPDTQADMVWKFIYEMKEGDIILLNYGHKTIFARGTVTSKAKIFDPNPIVSAGIADMLSDWPIYRTVTWEKISPELPIPREIEGKFSRRVIALEKTEYDLIFGKESAPKQKMPAKQYSKKQTILYGPPGTGKTYNTILRAHEIIFGYEDKSITYRTLQEKLRSEPKDTLDISQISWLEAIVLAFNELQKEKIQVDEIKNSKTIQDFSSFKNNHSISNTIWYTLQAESRIDSETVKSKKKSGRELFDKDTESNWYLTDNGKEYQQSLLADIQDTPISTDAQFQFVTFHQSFSYEDFVEGIRPKLDNSDNSQIAYDIKNGIFKEICKKADLDPENNYVLIIDEINRGNISKIFGELITLLEDNKRKGEKEEITVKLPYSGDDFCVPNNVYIIGTMNSTDKSIALVDIALRRRFHFERLNVNYDLIPNVDAKKFLRELNQIICAIKNSDYEIGHYYFMTISQEDGGNKELKSVFSNRILPLLEEYFFNDWEALATILGPESIQIDRRKKLIWDEDSGEFKKDTGDYDKIFGRCIKPADKVFEITMKHLGIRTQNPDVQE